MSETKAFFDYFPNLQLSDELKVLLQSRLVENAVYYKKKETVCLTIVFNEIISSETLAAIEKEIKSQVFLKHSLKIRIIPHFVFEENEGQSSKSLHKIIM